MGEVTVEVDEEVTEQDLLPEPLLIILSPPPPFLSVPGEPAIFWHKWLKAFEHYVEALGENELVDSSKCVLLQNCLGQEGQRIFTALIQGETTYAAAISALTLYFTSDHTSQMYRLKFHQRAQMPGETVEQFVSALEELLRSCNYRDVQDTLILTQLIEKTNCPQLKERLLLEKETLTLATALIIGKEVESALNHPELFDIHEVSVDIGDDLDLPVQRVAKRGRPRRGEKRAKTKPRETKTPRRSSRYKDNYCSSNDKLYRSDNEDYKSGDEGNLPRGKASEKGDGDNGASSSSHMMEEEGFDKASDDGDDDEDEDFSLPQTKQKEKPFKCSQCSKSFRSSSGLRLHSRQHMEVRPSYECPECGRTYGRMTELKMHQRYHTGDKPYSCTCCNKRFISKDKLNVHMRIHTGERPYSCPHCGQTFTQTGDRNRHINKYHS
eukprot:superscaffoldBa00002985_g15814